MKVLLKSKSNGWDVRFRTQLCVRNKNSPSERWFFIWLSPVYYKIYVTLSLGSRVRVLCRTPPLDWYQKFPLNPNCYSSRYRMIGRRGGATWTRPWHCTKPIVLHLLPYDVFEGRIWSSTKYPKRENFGRVCCTLLKSGRTTHYFLSVCEVSGTSRNGDQSMMRSPLRQIDWCPYVHSERLGSD